MAKRTAACRKIILEQYPEFCELLKSKPLSPVSEEFLGQMCSIPITTSDGLKLKEVLYDEYKIQVPIMRTQLDFEGRTNQVFLRISANVYNNEKDMLTLRNALEDIRKKSTLIQ